MFRMSFDASASIETIVPLVTCVTNDALSKSMPDIDETLSQCIDIINFRLVDLLLHYYPNFGVKWIQFSTVRDQMSGKINALSCWISRRKV